MKILMLNPFYHPYSGGTEKHVKAVSENLVMQGNNVFVLCALEGNSKETENVNGVNVIRVKSKVIYDSPHFLPPPYPLTLQFIKKYEEIIKKEKFDIVHIHNRFLFGEKFIEIAKREGAKIVLTIHNSKIENIDIITDFFGQSYDRVMGNRIMKKCDGIIGVSKDSLYRTIPKDYNGKRRVIYNGFEKIEHPKKINQNYWRNFFKGKGLHGKMILANARLIKQKGLEYLIDSMKKVKDAYLVILGRGPMEKKLKERARKNNVNVFFITERISEQKLYELYYSAEVFVLSSLYEPFGMVIIEAQASGLPVIATNVGGVPEIIEHGKTGLLVPPKNKEALLENINYLIKNEKERKRMGKKGRINIKKFLWKNISKQTEEFYKEILS
ncbi:MAG: glycosyltransferase family 4 protein [Candidatus ainarchaeum sp.]|nr:glycosyltransferase family 4 protein [Candidatus ainarchaeum sp.]